MTSGDPKSGVMRDRRGSIERSIDLALREATTQQLERELARRRKITEAQKAQKA